MRKLLILPLLLFLWGCTGGRPTDYYPNSCSDDAYEPNDTLAGASALSTGLSSTTYTGLVICSTEDDDYFSVVVAEDTCLTITAVFSGSAGDLTLYVYDGTTIIQSSSAGDNETITVIAGGARTITVRVFGEPNGYALVLTVGC